MSTLLTTLHVLFAIFLVGPLTMVPMTALRSIRRRDAPAVLFAARQTMLFGLGSILVFVLGFGVVSADSKHFHLGDPWIVISMTLYVVALVLTLLVLVPDLRRAGKLIEQGVLDASAVKPPVAAESTSSGSTASDSTASESTASESGTSEGTATDGPAGSEADEAAEPTLTATASDLAAKQRLDSLRGRAAAMAGLVTLLFAVIIVLMVVKPFS